MNLFITGRPGCGKSTLIQELIQALKGNIIAGIITPEIRTGGRKGFKIIDLLSRKEEILASVDIKSGPRIGKYGINVRAIDNIVGSFLENFEMSEYIFLDEIGRMELFSSRFKNMVNRILKSDKRVIAVLHRDLAGKYKRKGELIRLEKETFKQTKEYVLKSLDSSS